MEGKRWITNETVNSREESLANIIIKNAKLDTCKSCFRSRCPCISIGPKSSRVLTFFNEFDRLVVNFGVLRVEPILWIVGVSSIDNIDPDVFGILSVSADEPSEMLKVVCLEGVVDAS